MYCYACGRPPAANCAKCGKLVCAGHRRRLAFIPLCCQCSPRVGAVGAALLIAALVIGAAVAWIARGQP
jgi:hypothetical protein